MDVTLSRQISQFIEISHKCLSWARCHKSDIYFHYYGNMKNIDAIQSFLALGQESRLNVFRLIVQKGGQGITPSEIKETLGIPAATLSFHLKELYQANLILVERQSRNLVYRPNAGQVKELMDFLLFNCCGGQSCVPNVKLNQK